MKKSITFFVVIIFVQGIYAQQKDLSYFLRMGTQNSPLLKDYRNQIALKNIDSLLIQANHGIMVNAISAGMYAPVVNGWGYDQVITNIADVSAALSASKEITGHRVLDNQFQSLQYQKQSIDLSRKISKQELHKTITAQYITAYGNFRLYQSNKEILNVLKQQNLIIKKLTEQGVFHQTEYLSLMVNLHKQELRVAQLESQYKNAYAMLNYLCGITDTTSAPVPDPEIVPDSSSQAKSTFFYQQFVVDSLQLATDNARIDLQYQPKISLFADGGYHSSFAYEPWKNVGASAGFTISVPIYDGHQRKMQHDKISIEEKNRAGYRDFFVNQYQQKLDLLWQQLNSNKKLLKQAGQQVYYAKTLMKADNKLVNTGDISVTEYILAINNYLDARNTMVQQTISEYQIINEINYWSSAK